MQQEDSFKLIIIKKQKTQEVFLFIFPLTAYKQINKGTVPRIERSAKNMASCGGGNSRSALRKWQPTPVFLTEEFHGQKSYGVTKSWIQLSNDECPLCISLFLQRPANIYQTFTFPSPYELFLSPSGAPNHHSQYSLLNLAEDDI